MKMHTKDTPRVLTKEHALNTELSLLISAIIGEDLATKYPDYDNVWLVDNGDQTVGYRVSTENSLDGEYETIMFSNTEKGIISRVKTQDEEILETLNTLLKQEKENE